MDAPPGMTAPVLLASDIHLSEDDGDTVAAFLHFLQEVAPQAHALYLLGDLFEYWAGDDDDSPLIQQVSTAFQALARTGVAVYLMHGNRDFLMGSTFAHRSGATLLPEPYFLHLAGRQFLLCHGDTLCTDDKAYQQFRALVRQPDWQAQFLARPLAERLAEIAQMRRASQQANREKSSAIMDVNPLTVSTLLASHPGTHLIHGHTHRPGQHPHEVQHGLRCRWVLPDWYRGKGGYAVLDTQGLRLETYPPVGPWQ